VGEEPVGGPKPKEKRFVISKWVVADAYEKVKANRGAAGVDGESEFERDLKGNLYKLWNRLSSGSYFPPPVLAVEIPKKAGGSRTLGVPTVADRVAQTVVRMYLEPEVGPLFHPDSYGYRPGRSALDAVGECRKRCWKFDWVIDLDLRSFFDSIDHDLLLKAVSKHTDLPWVLLYVRWWLQAPLQREDGTVIARDRGTPQGSAISPLLANLFLHYAFDRWMARTFPGCPFERYADDAVIHCRSQASAPTSSTAAATRRWAAPGRTSTSPPSAARRSGRTHRRATRRPRRTGGGTTTTPTARKPDRASHEIGKSSLLCAKRHESHHDDVRRQ
jgi:RNA-directed DNA polymerase